MQKISAIMIDYTKLLYNKISGQIV